MVSPIYLTNNNKKKDLAVNMATADLKTSPLQFKQAKMSHRRGETIATVDCNWCFDLDRPDPNDIVYLDGNDTHKDICGKRPKDGCTYVGDTREMYDGDHAAELFRSYSMEAMSDACDEVQTFTADSDEGECREACKTFGKKLAERVEKGDYTTFCGAMIQCGWCDLCTRIMCLSINRNLNEMMRSPSYIREMKSLHRGIKMLLWILEDAVELYEEILLDDNIITAPLFEKYNDALQSISAFNSWCSWVAGTASCGKVWNSGRSLKVTAKLKKRFGPLYERILINFGVRACMLLDGMIQIVMKRAEQWHERKRAEYAEKLAALALERQQRALHRSNKQTTIVGATPFTHIDDDVVSVYKDEGF